MVALNLAPIGEVVSSVVNILPNFVSLIVGVLPLLVVVTVAGFILVFFDKILEMIKF